MTRSRTLLVPLICVGIVTSSVAATKTKTKQNVNPNASACAAIETPLQLNVLNGSDADALAQTFSTIFPDLTVRAVSSQQAAASGANTNAPVPSNTQQSNPKNVLCVGARPLKPITRTWAASLNHNCRSMSTASSPKADDYLKILLPVFDRDNFRGININSNFIVAMNNLCAADISTALSNPTYGFEFEAVPGNYVVFVPSSPIIQTPAIPALSTSAQGLKQDFRRLDEIANPELQKPPSALIDAINNCKQACTPGAFNAAQTSWEAWLMSHTVPLTALAAREVALAAPQFMSAYRLQPNARLNALTFLPQALQLPGNGPILSAQALQNQQLAQHTKQGPSTQAVTPPSGGSAQTANPSSLTTTTTSTTKINANTSSSKNNVPTTSIAATTVSSTSPQSGGVASPNTSNASGSQTAHNSSSTSSSPNQSLQLRETYQMDHIIRLYHLRDAAGIANAINSSNAGSNNAQPLVVALSDNGANDLLQVLPPPPGQTDHSVDIERAIALLDLPKPQLSLQVWSFQISSEIGDPNKPHSKAGDPADDTAKCVTESVRDANDAMTTALRQGLTAIYSEATKKQAFFDPVFHEYLTGRYSDCISKDRYCLGFWDALEVPKGSNATGAANASLDRLILFLAAANDSEYTSVGATLKDSILSTMKATPSSTNVTCKKPGLPTLEFPNFGKQLSTLSDAHNRHVLQAELLDFLFHYKWTLNYPNDFIPYDLQHSAHELDALLQPVIDAFNADVDKFVQGVLDSVRKDSVVSKTGLTSAGTVQVSTLSGTTASVSGQASNYFDITQTPSLSEVFQTLLGAGSQGGGGQSASSGGTGGNAGGSAAAAKAITLRNIFSANQLGEAAALANIISPARITAELNKGLTLTIIPTSLDTAGSAELNVNLAVNELGGAPGSVNTTTTKRDLLDRVANHQVTSDVRVESLKLFDISTFGMQLSHPQTPTCTPTRSDGWKYPLYVADVALAPPCAVWRSIFGTTPVVGDLFQWPRGPLTVDNRSVAIVRATVAPTAMDLGLGLNYENDRLRDSVTQTLTPLYSLQQLGGRPRQFHRHLMQCIVEGQYAGVLGCTNANPSLRLSTTDEDLR